MDETTTPLYGVGEQFANLEHFSLPFFFGFQKRWVACTPIFSTTDAVQIVGLLGSSVQTRYQAESG